MIIQNLLAPSFSPLSVRHWNTRLPALGCNTSLSDSLVVIPLIELICENISLLCWSVSLSQGRSFSSGEIIMCIEMQLFTYKYVNLLIHSKAVKAIIKEI